MKYKNVLKYLKYHLNILFLIFLVIFSVSCGEGIQTNFSNHKVYVFDSGENIQERDYVLAKESRDTLIRYTYQYKPDQDRNIEFTYLPKKNVLNFGYDDFEEIKEAAFKIDIFSETVFKIYKSTSTATDVTDPIFFNQEYGVLAIGNVMAPTVVFLPQESDLKTAQEIFDLTINY